MTDETGHAVLLCSLQLFRGQTLMFWALHHSGTAVQAKEVSVLHMCRLHEELNASSMNRHPLRKRPASLHQLGNAEDQIVWSHTAAWW